MCFKEVKMEKWPDLPYLFTMYPPPIGCCVRTNHKPGGLLIGDIQFIIHVYKSIVTYMYMYM